MTLFRSIAKMRCQFRNLCKEFFSGKNILYIDGDLHFNYERGDFSGHNLGDDLNIPLLEKLSGRQILPIHYLLGHRSKADVLLAIGSILETSLRKNSIVWGAGFKEKPSDEAVVRPRFIHAVRGPMTREVFLKHGIECPEIFGDPAILLRDIYMPSCSKQYDVALIPHVCDYDKPFTRQWRDAGRKLLDLRHYGNWQTFINELCQCKTIISSSLHGIILAEAYGIPAVRIRYPDNQLVGDFKFSDYFLSYRKAVPSALIADTMKEPSFYMDAAMENADAPGNTQKENLLKAFPFPVSLTK